MESKHFKETIYAQFVAGCLRGEEQKAFEEHLYAGCHACEAAVNWYLDLSKHLLNEAAYEPPEATMKSVTNAFRLRKPETVNLVAVLANLVYDSFLQPLPVGVRQAVLSERQILYQAGNMELDLKIEKVNEEKEHMIIGQLVPQSGEASTHLNTFKVILRDGDSILQSTYSNELGEFVFHVVPRKSYALEMLLADSQQILLSNIPGRIGKTESLTQ